MTKDSNTEQKIKEAAQQIFVKKGLTGARMQEIADLAGINKAMLHYYYRSKDKLFEAIFIELFGDFAPKIFGAMGSDLPIDKKVEHYVNEIITTMTTHPELPLFIFNELRNNPNEFINKMGINPGGMLEKIDSQLKEEAEAGTIRPISVHEFMINMASMCIFPFLAKPMFQGLFKVDDSSFYTIMEMRKKTIPEYIMNSIRVKN